MGKFTLAAVADFALADFVGWLLLVADFPTLAVGSVVLAGAVVRDLNRGAMTDSRFVAVRCRLLHQEYIERWKRSIRDEYDRPLRYK